MAIPFSRPTGPQDSSMINNDRPRASGLQRNPFRLPEGHFPLRRYPRIRAETRSDAPLTTGTALSYDGRSPPLRQIAVAVAMPQVPLFTVRDHGRPQPSVLQGNPFRLPEGHLPIRRYPKITAQPRTDPPLTEIP